MQYDMTSTSRTLLQLSAARTLLLLLQCCFLDVTVLPVLRRHAVVVFFLSSQNVLLFLMHPFAGPVTLLISPAAPIFLHPRPLQACPEPQAGISP